MPTVIPGDEFILQDAAGSNNDIWIHDGDKWVRKTPAESLAILSGQAAASFSMNTQKITNVVDPTADQEAATKKYADDAIDADIATHAAAADPHTGYRKESDTDYLDKTHLSQDFGATGGRLYNLIVTPIADDIMRITNAGASAFNGVINSAGTGGLTATNVPYDGDANENMFNGLQSGAAYWGRIILHNTTRSNTRKIVSVDIANNAITTESSTDDWADNDVITVQTQQSGFGAGYFEVDVSASVAATVTGVFVVLNAQDQSSAGLANRNFAVHPYATYNSAKLLTTTYALADQRNAAPMVLVSMISQKLIFRLRGTDSYILATICAIVEPADT